MLKRLFSILAALLFMAGAAPVAQAELADLGIPINPHGYPAWYSDANGLQLELCVPPPAGFATRPELCIGDPIEVDGEGNPINPIVLTGESFWWMASASVDMPGGGSADLEFAIEATFGGAEAAIDGQQISFGRTRIRIDTPAIGTYTVTHPYGVIEFEVTDAAEGINFTSDIGAANFLDPAAGFRGTLSTPIGPFLTWPDYDTNPALQVLAEDGTTVLEQYVGDPSILTTVVGSPNDFNMIRIEGPDGLLVEADQFSVMGKVFDPTQTLVAHVFPEAPFPIWFAVGPVNRVAPFASPTTGTVTGVDILNYPVGYPIWYQENIGTITEPAGGLKVTLCTPGDPMCISDPIDTNVPEQVALRTGGEGFWWMSSAGFDVGADALSVEFALEATFGGDESLIDGQQISFTRTRIRIDTNEIGAGTYRVTHPYGTDIFEDVPADDVGINHTADVGIANPADPDGAFVGAMYSLGPQILKWTTFNPNPALTDPRLVKPDINDPTQTNYFVGDPAILETVSGSPTGNNFFRVEKLDGEDWVLIGETDEFSVSGQVFDPVALGLPAGSGALGVAIGGAWYLDANNNGIWEQGVDMLIQYGSATDQPLMGDWNGDGISTPGVKRGNTYFLRNSNTSGVADIAFSYGAATDTPLVGDWDGNGTDTIGIKRGGAYHLRNSNSAGAADIVFSYGAATDTPVVGDWDGNNTDTIGIKRGGAYHLRNSNSAGAADIIFSYGAATDTPVVGDWDGNGTDTVGVYRSTNGRFYLRNSNTSGVADTTLNFGITGGVPVTGSW